MNRPELAEVAQSLRSHLEIIEHFIAYPPESERAMELEILARCNSLEAGLARMRAGVMAKDSGRPDTVHLPDIIRKAFGVSGAEARRLISAGGVRIDGEVVTGLDVPLSPGARLTLGTRREHVLGDRPVVA